MSVKKESGALHKNSYFTLRLLRVFATRAHVREDYKRRIKSRLLPMPITVSTSDIARAAKVSQRTVQTHLKRTKTRPDGEKWRFDLYEFPALVNEIQGARRRNRKNVFTREGQNT